VAAATGGARKILSCAKIEVMPVSQAEINAMVKAGNLGGRSWGNVVYNDEQAAEKERVARLTPAQREAEAREAEAERAAWNAGAEARAAETRRVMNEAARANAERNARGAAGRAAVAAARANLNAGVGARAAAASRFGSLRGNNRGANNRRTRASRDNNRRNRGSAHAARLPPGKMARECRVSNVGHAHEKTGEPCRFMHKDEPGFELLREDQKRNGPPKGGRSRRGSRKAKRSTRRH
jgi:hypothetical protein